MLHGQGHASRFYKKSPPGRRSQQAAGPYSRSWGFPTFKYHFKPKRGCARRHPETNENRHKRLAQHIGSPRRGVPAGGNRKKVKGNFFEVLKSASNQ